MYWLDIGFQKMQKTEVSDGTFPNSDTPFWMLRIIFLECWFRKVIAAMIDLGSGWKGKDMERKGRKRNGKAKEKERTRIGKEKERKRKRKGKGKEKERKRIEKRKGKGKSKKNKRNRKQKEHERKGTGNEKIIERERKGKGPFYKQMLMHPADSGKKRVDFSDAIAMP